uniref:Hypothetical secreted protein 1452 n=1 Tax=Amblyomma variegatum TaxID=34610 RepID=F0J9W1_AMBVA|nr:TPA_inf: hypothetical secreted protein 1452 [Amblyomma variegatum]
MVLVSLKSEVPVLLCFITLASALGHDQGDLSGKFKALLSLGKLNVKASSSGDYPTRMGHMQVMLSLIYIIAESLEIGVIKRGSTSVAAAANEQLCASAEDNICAGIHLIIYLFVVPSARAF